MKNRFIPASILISCAPVSPESPTYPIEYLTCEHPTTPYEAVVIASVAVDEVWADIVFTISQGDLEWQTELWEPDETNATWGTRMRLYELDCSANYEHEFSYIR